MSSLLLFADLDSLHFRMMACPPALLRESFRFPLRFATQTLAARFFSFFRVIGRTQSDFVSGDPMWRKHAYRIFPTTGLCNSASPRRVSFFGTFLVHIPDGAIFGVSVTAFLHRPVFPLPEGNGRAFCPLPPELT